ncbi:glycosyltransferase family 4 protein [Parvibaculum sp.]|uniref:glycosyltransferase family 4 protein n=1 Tax=Parvibaculum sp. TaxID=2024848 RepID=UPI00261831A4|nr:glycosyltransferase family 4 protein [Parvibaculum sp.]MCW5726921.1 glycosyltransferase family 4 protein [Parvibaculum sp.]
MRVLQVHNLYQQRGGEDVVVENEAALLRRHGHKVAQHFVSNDGIRNLSERIKTAFSVTYSHTARDELARRLDEERPDIVHVHNTFPLLTPAIYDTCEAAGIHVVQTLHNYRIACANALFLRDGHVCEDCLVGSPWQGALHRCYRGSLPGSVAVARSIAHHRHADTWNRKVTRFIALTEFAKSKFAQAGIDAERIAVKPNFIEDPLAGADLPSPAARQGALFVGRLSEEKGIAVLLDAWRNLDYPLTVVGGGPLLASLKENAPGNVSFSGPLPPAEVFGLMRRAAFLVMPSTCYEGFPMTLAEAFACGLPVLASNIGSLGELIENETTGLLFQSGSPGALAAKALQLASDPDRRARFGFAARTAYLEHYTPDTNYALLERIYSEAMADHAAP